MACSAANGSGQADPIASSKGSGNLLQELHDEHKKTTLLCFHSVHFENFGVKFILTSKAAIRALSTAEYMQ